MVLYNTTNLESANNLFEIFREINTLSGQFLAGVFLAAVGILLILVFRRNPDFEKVMIAVSFVMSIVSILMWAQGFIGMTIMIAPMIILVASIIATVWGS